MQNIGSSYSKIINAESYNKLMSEQHIYISNSDHYLSETIQKLAKNNQSNALELVEIGCGPARITGLINRINNINLSAIDVDPDFLEYARSNIPQVNFVQASAFEYKHSSNVDIFYSQGFHHHIAKGTDVNRYLQNIYSQLKDGGYYILSDEFIPNYINEEDRSLKIIIWYSHVISHALVNNYEYLAREEAKTLLDDLNEGQEIKAIKNEEKIQLVLNHVHNINQSAVEGNHRLAESLCKKLLEELQYKISENVSDDDTISLSRGDYKICDKVFRNEVEKVGFKIIEQKAFGSVDFIGGMVVYLLQK